MAFNDPQVANINNNILAQKKEQDVNNKGKVEMLKAAANGEKKQETAKPGFSENIFPILTALAGGIAGGPAGLFAGIASGLGARHNMIQEENEQNNPDAEDAAMTYLRRAQANKANADADETVQDANSKKAMNAITNAIIYKTAQNLNSNQTQPLPSNKSIQNRQTIKFEDL